MYRAWPPRAAEPGGTCFRLCNLAICIGAHCAPFAASNVNVSALERFAARLRYDHDGKAEAESGKDPGGPIENFWRVGLNQRADEGTWRDIVQPSRFQWCSGEGFWQPAAANRNGRSRGALSDLYSGQKHSANRCKLSIGHQRQRAEISSDCKQGR